MQDDLSKLFQDDASKGRHVRSEQASELRKKLEPELQTIATQIEQRINRHFSLYEGIQEQNQMAELVSRFRGYVKNLGQAGEIVAHVRLGSARDTLEEIAKREREIYDSLSGDAQPIIDVCEKMRREDPGSLESAGMAQFFDMVVNRMDETGLRLVQKRLYAATDVSGIEQLQLELQREVSRPR